MREKKKQGEKTERGMIERSTQGGKERERDQAPLLGAWRGEMEGSGA